MLHGANPLRLTVGQVFVVQVHGNPKPTTKRAREWVCPDCDYFEDAEEEGR